ncbi:DUF6635 family protein [Agaribacterium haliotis]|uniref:DUF6635 family protein n=1 Tax=Agaribacterium haliotis TaxID=2013869 RepID=UPI0011774D2B|nr:DUF6635 family protein [Agaribacterium haliotis]
MNQIKLNSHRQALVNQALRQGLQDYFDDRRTQVKAFVKQEFSYPGCWHNNKHAFGWDLLRVPLNLLWAPLYLLLQLLCLTLKHLGPRRLKPLVTQTSRRLPAGFRTAVQRLLNNKYRQVFVDTALLKHYICARLEQLPQREFDEQQQLELERELGLIVDDVLEQLMLSRTAHADIGNTVFSTAVGALAFKKFTPGGIGLGVLLAALWVRWRAEQDFWLGEFAGGLYYRLFPPSPNLYDLVLACAAVMLALAFIASFSGLIIDPVLRLTGSHQRRLKRMLKHMHRDLLASTGNQYRSLDPYIARILELFDTVKAPLSL